VVKLKNVKKENNQRKKEKVNRLHTLIFFPENINPTTTSINYLVDKQIVRKGNGQ
jgi:hypothetical protein